MSEWTSEWPSTYVSILVCSRPQCTPFPPLLLPFTSLSGAIKLDVCFEDESETTSRCDLPSALDLFREARQNAYGILYNAKQKQISEGKMSRAELDNSLLVKEW